MTRATRLARNMVAGFFMGAVACLVLAAVDLARLKGDYLSQLPFSYAASEFGAELWSNWPLALVLGIAGAAGGFVATLAKRADVRSPRAKR